MILSRSAREFYSLEIVTDPPITDWEASFDGGDTWHAATVVDNLPSWLVAGPNADLGTAVAVITRSITPLIRAADAPELIVRDAPRIHLQ